MKNFEVNSIFELAEKPIDCSNKNCIEANPTKTAHTLTHQKKKLSSDNIGRFFFSSFWDLKVQKEKSPSSSTDEEKNNWYSSFTLTTPPSVQTISPHLHGKVLVPGGNFLFVSHIFLPSSSRAAVCTWYYQAVSTIFLYFVGSFFDF